jgi:hypothetical protein
MVCTAVNCYIYSVYRDRMRHIEILCAKMQCLLMLQQVVYTVTTENYITKLPHYTITSLNYKTH